MIKKIFEGALTKALVMGLALGVAAIFYTTNTLPSIGQVIIALAIIITASLMIKSRMQSLNSIKVTAIAMISFLIFSVFMVGMNQVTESFTINDTIKYAVTYGVFSGASHFILIGGWNRL